MVYTKILCRTTVLNTDKKVWPSLAYFLPFDLFLFFCSSPFSHLLLVPYSSSSILKIKLRWALFVTYTIIQSITSSEMCSLHLTHPRAHTLGPVGSQHSGARGAVGGSVPCSRVSPQSWNSSRSRDSNPQPRVTSPTLYPLGHDSFILL